MAARNCKYCISATLLATSVATAAAFAELPPPRCEGSSVFNFFVTPQNCEIDRSAPAMHGPFEFLVEFSDKMGYVYTPRYANDIGSSDALAGELDFGPKTLRPALTWGHAFSDALFAKVTVEYFDEKTEYEYFSGIVDEWQSQWDFGADVRYRFYQQLGLDSFHIAVQYVSSASTELANQSFGAGLTNVRRIAGGVERGVELGIRLQPWNSGYIDLGLDYDSLQYKFERQSGTTISGFGITMAWHQNLSERWQLLLSATNRKPYYEYLGGFKWIARHSAGSLLEVGAQFSKTGGETAISRENRLGLGIFYSWGGDVYSNPVVYGDPLNRGLRQELVDYATTPATRLPQIFGMTDQSSF